MNYQVVESEVAKALRTIWENKVNLSLVATALNVYHAQILFTDLTAKKSFPAKYMINSSMELSLQYAPDCKICHNQTHMLQSCPFHDIRPTWNIGLGEQTGKQKKIIDEIQYNNYMD